MQLDHSPLALDLHPLCTLFPCMSDAEFDALKADIISNGLNEAIVVHDGLILDGGNRYRACVETGVAPVLRNFAGVNPAAYVLSANLHRRHLSPGQQAVIVSRAQDWSAARPIGAPGANDKGATLHLSSVADRAAQSGASIRTQKTADKVAKASPEMALQVAHGEISLPKTVEQLAAATAPAHDDSDAPGFGVIGAAMPAPAPAPVGDVDAGAPDPFELLREEVAKTEQLQDQVDALAARVKLLSEGDRAAKMIALELDRDGIRNRAAMHYEEFSKANNKVIELKNQWAAEQIIARADAFRAAQLAMRAQRFDSQWGMRACSTPGELAHVVYQCDQFAPAIGYQVFDAAYNGGMPVRWLQAAVGATVDGVGAKTIAAVRAADPAKVVLSFNASRLQYLTSLCGWASIGKGWARRIADNLLKGDRTPKILAYLVTAGSFGMLVFMLFKPIPGENRDIVNIMLGVLSSTFGGIVAYYYGSTKGSEAKSALLAQSPPPAPDRRRTVAGLRDEVGGSGGRLPMSYRHCTVAPARRIFATHSRVSSGSWRSSRAPPP